MPATRSDHRDRIMTSIRDTAVQRLRTHGTAGLTIRGIAADLDLSPGALYRYYDGLDEILTAVITDGYASLAMALAGVTATEAPLADAQAVANAYRDWATAHPHTFQLLFGDPIPGYRAPTDGPTTAGMTRMGQALLAPLVRAWDAGLVTPGTAFVPHDRRIDQLREAMAAGMDDDIPPQVAAWAMAMWGLVHGLVALELNGQFAWLFDDDAGPQFMAATQGMLDAVTA